MSVLTFQVSDGTRLTIEIKLEQVIYEGFKAVKVKIDVIEGNADLRGFFFNIKNDDLLDSLKVKGDHITTSDFSGDVSTVGQGDNNVNPLSFEGGVEIGTQGIGEDDIGDTEFILYAHGQDFDLHQFVHQSIAIRATSVSDNRTDSVKLTAVVPKLLVVEGYKFHDLNADGVWDMEKEPGLEGWKIVVKDQDGNILAYTTTGEGGFYSVSVGISDSVEKLIVKEKLEDGWHQPTVFTARRDWPGIYNQAGALARLSNVRV